MLPEAFLERMRRMLGEEYGAFLEAMEQERSQGLCLNPMKLGMDGRSAAQCIGSAEESLGVAERLGSAAGRLDDMTERLRDTSGQQMAGSCFSGLSKVPWAENGYYYPSGRQPGKHPFHEAGLYYIQEPSAMAPVELLDVKPGERVLDLCAAPGGKSVQIAGKLRGKGWLLCNEVHPARAKVLSENIERMGIRCVCVVNEAPERLAERFPGYFDRILVDAPCSGEGMFRKNEVACGEWSLENVRLCAERQDGILACAAGMLRPGGRLVYSTCTFAPEEDEGSVSRFLRRFTEFRILPVEKERLGLAGCDGVPGYLEDPAEGLEQTVRLWPHRVRGEGHFAAVLQKGDDFRQEGDAFQEGPGPRSGCTQKGQGLADREAVDAFARFCSENLKSPGSVLTGAEEGLCYLSFGSNLYLAPFGRPSLKGLRVLRPGLHLGEAKKGRFEPSHALALALDPSAAHVWNLKADSPEIDAYLEGRTLPAEGEKGWYLVCADGFGLGWGKLAGGVMKNHYPRGLRR